MKTRSLTLLTVSLVLILAGSLTGCGKGQPAKPKATPAATARPAVKPPAGTKSAPEAEADEAEPAAGAPARTAAAKADGKEGDELQKQAEAGDAQAQYTLGRVCEGSADPDEVNQAVAWYKRSAKQGHVEAMYHAGLCYLHGRGGAPANQARAIKMFEAAAEAGSPEAKAELAKVRPPAAGNAGDEETAAAETPAVPEPATNRALPLLPCSQSVPEPP